MLKYRVEVAYRTKRGGFCDGMTIEAASENDAISEAHKRTLMGRPARKHAYTYCRLEDYPLPDYDACEAAVKAGTATALQRFIQANEPAGAESEAEFRRQLTEVIAELNCGGPG